MSESQHKLEGSALGTFESVVMGVAGTAPAFSVAATTTTLIAAVGILSPASILYCGFIMFGITLAFMHLNKTDANAGASYAWVSREFAPVIGFFAGWALLVASALFMVSGSIPAATSTLHALAPQLAQDPVWVNAVAGGWLILVSALIIKGIKATSYSQIIMTVIEVGVLILITVLAFIKYGSHPLHPIQLHHFYITSFTPDLFVTGALTSLFFYWGWDVTVNLNEETRNGSEASSRAAMWAMMIAVLLFIGFVTAVMLALSDQEINQSTTDIMFTLSEKVLPQPWGYLTIVAVILSSIGTLETSILQFTRTLFAKGRDSVLHPRFAKLHPSWRTPWVATLTITFFGLLFLFLASKLPSVSVIIKHSVEAIGFQICFYYSLTGFACAWHFRHTAFKSLSHLVLPVFLFILRFAV
jgi:amino acid transporter